MSDIKKWMVLAESVNVTLLNQPTNNIPFNKNDTVTISPAVGGGVGRFVQYTSAGALIDIKGIHRELSLDNFSNLTHNTETGNDWSHASVDANSIGTLNDKPEFTSGDIVRVADVYGAVIGPGLGIFIAYSTEGKDCIISFDGKEIMVPVANVSAVLEQHAKDNFGEVDNDGNLSPMSLGAQNIKIEEPAMDHKDEFSKWMSAIEEALTQEHSDGIIDTEQGVHDTCGCGSWDCSQCFPEPGQADLAITVGGGSDGSQPNQTGIGMAGTHPVVCPACGHSAKDGDDHEHQDDEYDFSTLGGLEFDEETVDDFTSRGGKVTTLPYMGAKEKNPYGSKHIGSRSGRETSKAALRGSKANVSTSTVDVKPVVGEVDEDAMDITQDKTPRSGKGIKLGHIVQQYKQIEDDGEDSPMTYGGDNLEEAEWDVPEEPDYDADPMARQDAYDEMQSIDPDEAMEMIGKIMYMQDIGMSKGNQSYTEEQLAGMNAVQLKKVHNEVLGTVSEEDEMQDQPQQMPQAGGISAPQGGQGGVGTYPPGTAPTMPESCATMEGVDPEVLAWMKRFSNLDGV